jgi:2-dehydro-3-deoxyglucarate aldolase/4-hydroxy-2-oxoheptanedioate aldolase
VCALRRELLYCAFFARGIFAMVIRLKTALAQGRLTRVFGVGQLCHPKLVEIVGLQGGFDAVWLDQEHAGLGIEQIEHAARAARAVGLDSFVRLTPTDYATVMRPLEAGAGGVMAAQIRSAAEAADVVRWAKFHPEGMRGVNGTGVDGRYGTLPLAEYFRRANAETFVAIQIEHVDAVEEVEQIAALAGVDVLFIGPADLSQSMGLPADWEHPRVWQAIERVARAAAAHKIHWAILPPGAAYAQRCVDLGCRMLSLGLDVWAVQRGLKAFQNEYAAQFSSIRDG